MRRDINWTTKREDGTKYNVRITWFGGRFRFQFKEGKDGSWDYERKPSGQDLADFLDAIRRRYQRREATLKELELAQKMADLEPVQEGPFPRRK